MRFLVNSSPYYKQPLLHKDAEALGVNAYLTPQMYLKACPRYQKTPLYALPALAAKLGVGGIYIKDEGQRLGLGSFKALGGAYAVMRLVKEHAETLLHKVFPMEDLLSPDICAVAQTMTMCCATDGNHGRSVAAGARLMGCRAVIYVHAGVSEQRISAIRAYGADIVHVSGTYDDSVEEARAQSISNGWTIVSDTSWLGYEYIPTIVMQGYTVMADEIIQQLAVIKIEPSHMLLQAGVGGFAAAMAAHFTQRLPDRSPKILVVEPENVDCLYQSILAGKATKVDHHRSTLMAMLECYEPSMVALRILERCADGFLTTPDDCAEQAMKLLAYPQQGDPAIVSGESGAAGLAGLLSLLDDIATRQDLGLNEHAQILLVNTENASDKTQFKHIVGCTPEDVLSQSTKDVLCA